MSINKFVSAQIGWLRTVFCEFYLLYLRLEGKEGYKHKI